MKTDTKKENYEKSTLRFCSKKNFAIITQNIRDEGANRINNKVLKLFVYI